MNFRSAILVLSLLALWLLLSGIYKPLIIGFGVFSSICCIWIASKLNLVGKRGLASDVSLSGLVSYLFWLTVEIGKADWAVAKVILSETLPVRHRLIAVPASQKSDFGKMIFANSITITPGTITVETETDHFIVHALTDNAADQKALAEMGKNVSALERQSAGQP